MGRDFSLSIFWSSICGLNFYQNLFIQTVRSYGYSLPKRANIKKKYSFNVSSSYFVYCCGVD